MNNIRTLTPKNPTRITKAPEPEDIESSGYAVFGFVKDQGFLSGHVVRHSKKGSDPSVVFDHHVKTMFTGLNMNFGVVLGARSMAAPPAQD